MAGQFFKKGRLAEAFRNSFTLDEPSKRQLKAGLLTTAFGYAALGLACAVDANASYMLIKQFTWQHLPLHGLFMMGTNLAGAAGMAGYDRLKRRHKGENTETPAAEDRPQNPDTPKP